MDLQLRGKVAVATGASVGIGLAVADALAGSKAFIGTGCRRWLRRSPTGATPDSALVRGRSIATRVSCKRSSCPSLNLASS